MSRPPNLAFLNWYVYQVFNGCSRAFWLVLGGFSFCWKLLYPPHSCWRKTYRLVWILKQRVDKLFLPSRSDYYTFYCTGWTFCLLFFWKVLHYPTFSFFILHFGHKQKCELWRSEINEKNICFIGVIHSCQNQWVLMIKSLRKFIENFDPSSAFHLGPLEGLKFCNASVMFITV